MIGEFDPTAHTSTLSNDIPLMLGRHVTWADSYLDGSMDELLIIKRALAAEEIQQLIERAAINLPQEGTLSLSSPTPGTYNGSVNIAGSYTTEPALTAVALEIIGAAETPIPVSVQIDPNAAAGEFNIAADCRIFSPGSHTIRARLTDSLEQTILSQPVSFDFRLPEPKVELEITSNDNSGVYIYGRTDFSGCPLPEGQSPKILVSVNERLIDVDVVNGQLPGDFVFGVDAQWLQPGENIIQVDVIDPRDSEAVGSARIGVSIESPLALTILNPIVGASLTGHVQVYGYFSNARGPMTLYSELDGKPFIENILVNDNQTFTFTIPAELLQAADYHGLYLRALDQGTQQQAETKTEFLYRPGSELTPGGDVLVLNDMNALWREENRPWFLNWVNFESGFDSGRKNSVQFVVSEATCKLVDAMEGHCARAKVVMSELYQEYGYELSIIERESLAEIPDHIKVLILFLPDSEFNEKEILAIKKFAASGGRVVYVGESYSCPECYSEAAQAQFLQQMGVDVRQERGLHYDTLYKPNGQPHQLTEGVEVISVVDAGVFAVGANVTPLVISEFNQVIAAVAKINTNPYQSLQIGIASPRDGETYVRNQLPPLTGFIEQADSSAGNPVITATIRSSATRLPEVLDVTDCWLTGCVLPSANLADENVIDVRAVTTAGFSATDSVAFSLAPEIRLTAAAADRSTNAPLMRDIQLTIASSAPLVGGQVMVNQVPVQELRFSATQIPYEYSAVVSGANFVSGVNNIRVDLYNTANAAVSASTNVDYLSTEVDGNFSFGIGIGYSLLDTATNRDIQGVLYGFPSGVTGNQLTLNALYVDGKRAEFSGRPTAQISFNYRFSRQFLDESLGVDSQKLVLATAYLGGVGTTISGEALFALYRYPGGRSSSANEQRQITHLSVDGHGQMAALSSGENMFDGTGEGNLSIVSGSGPNRYYFDNNSGADVITPNATSVANNTVGNVLSYWGLTIQNLRFARIAGTGDLLIAYGTGYPSAFSWQLVEGFFNYQRRPITSIAIPGDGSIPASANIASYEWTRWGDSNTPDRVGEFESISSWKDAGMMPSSCEPIAIQARLNGSTQILWPGDINQDSGVESFDVETGYTCVHANSVTGSCANYEVRYLCPLQ